MEATPTHTATEEDRELYQADAGMTSLVSYPQRCNEWGDWSYRGNCDGRLFLNLVLRYQAKRVADPMMGSGTTRDVVAGLNEKTHHRVDYWGSDLHEGFDLSTMSLPGTFDFVWLHPPYWNIIRYSDDQRDLSTSATYQHFVERLTTCVQRCYQALTVGGRLAVLVADVRRQGAYFPIVREVLNLEGAVGSLRSIIIREAHNCWSDRIVYRPMEDVPIQHEYCVVFKK
jgi:hypothetical protein